MRITGAHVVPFPVGAVWDALLDPAVLVRTIPGCERLETMGEHTYAMTVTAGVAAIKGTYDGTCRLSDLVEPDSLTMRLQGSGAPGTVEATVAVTFESLETGTRIGYDADAVVGGMVGGVGQRMLGSVSKRLAGEFFDNVGGLLASTGVATAADTGADWSMSWEDGAPGPGALAPTVFTAPARSEGPSGFFAGVAVGAGLVALGVVLGGILGRRR